MKTIKNVTHDEERAFYGSNDLECFNIKISGPLDGESAFKECKNVTIYDSTFDLRYPFWHNKNLVIKNSGLSATCRAALWYDNNVVLDGCKLEGVKAFRECSNVTIKNSNIISEEFGWNCFNINIIEASLVSVYAFFGSANITIENLNFIGKYSFQYCRNITINNCKLDTKDAFWHSRNVIVKNSDVKGEYLGWYSKNITFINCHISGTQPLCYARNIKFIDCTTDGCDLSFENTSIKGNINGDIVSIKNPIKGKLIVTGKTELIQDLYDKSKGRFKLRNK